MDKLKLAILIRWIARIWSIASGGLLLLFFIGEGFNPAQITAAQWLLLAFFPVGVLAGMVVGWFKEGLGGTITLCSLLLFYFCETLSRGSPPAGWAFVLIAAPGVLFLLSWWQARQAMTVDSDEGLA